MKKLLFLCLFLTGCNQDFATETHKFAKFAAPDKACYDVTQPEELAGHYCLQYMGKTK